MISYRLGYRQSPRKGTLKKYEETGPEIQRSASSGRGSGLGNESSLATCAVLAWANYSHGTVIFWSLLLLMSLLPPCFGKLFFTQFTVSQSSVFVFSGVNTVMQDFGLILVPSSLNPSRAVTHSRARVSFTCDH